MLALKTDFFDYYDHRFSPSWVTDATEFSRMSRDGLSRPEMLKKLEGMGLNVPLHGDVKTLRGMMINQISFLGNSKTISDFEKSLLDVIVYHDPFAHAGEGKERINIAEAALHYPDTYASQFIPANPKGLGESLRYLRIGALQFWLSYKSTNDWRSNAGDVTIKILSQEKNKSDDALIKTETPLLAIDFVRGDKLYAVDYNTAPGLRGTGLEDFLAPKVIYSQIENWFSAKSAHERLSVDIQEQS